VERTPQPQTIVDCAVDFLPTQHRQRPGLQHFIWVIALAVGIVLAVAKGAQRTLPDARKGSAGSMSKASSAAITRASVFGRPKINCDLEIITVTLYIIDIESYVKTGPDAHCENIS